MYSFFTDNTAAMDPIKNIISAAIYLISILTTVLFIMIQKDVINFISNLADFEKYGEPATLSRIIHQSAVLTRIVLISVVVLYFVNSIYQLKSQTCYELESKLKLDLLSCGTFLPSLLPRLPKYISIILGIMELIWMIGISTGGAMIVMVYWESFNVIGCHIDHLNRMFENILSEDCIDRRRYRMKLWIKYHNRIIW